MQDFSIVSDFYARLLVRMWSNLFIIIMISHTRFICFFMQLDLCIIYIIKYYLSFRQTNGFSPMWILRCTFNSPLCVNFLSQSGQANGFSPVLILQCLFNSLLCFNFLSQSGQTNGFSPVWILRCKFNPSLCVNFIKLIIHFIYKNIDIIYWYQSSLKPTFQWFGLLQSGWDPFWVDYIYLMCMEYC